jgi:TPR repeat protein
MPFQSGRALSVIKFFGRKQNRSRQHSGLQDALKRAAFGDPFAQTLVGFLANNGLGMPRNREQAREWYQQAANEGYAPAQYCLAILSDEEGDRERAIEYLKAAADQDYAPALFLLGVAHRVGDRVQKDLQKSEDLLTRATQNKYSAWYAGGAHGHSDETLAPPALEAADLDKLRLLAEAGNERDCRTYGMALVEHGKTDAERSGGLEWIRNACEHGDIAACLFLAQGHSFGHYGCKIDRKLARKYRNLANRALSKK